MNRDVTDIPDATFAAARTSFYMVSKCARSMIPGLTLFNSDVRKQSRKKYRKLVPNKGLGNFMEEPLRTYLRKRHMVKNKEARFILFSSRKLYDTHGVCKAPTTVDWRKARAFR
jgi:hypothetical protein